MEKACIDYVWTTYTVQRGCCFSVYSWFTQLRVCNILIRYAKIYTDFLKNRDRDNIRNESFVLLTLKKYPTPILGQSSLRPWFFPWTDRSVKKFKLSMKLLGTYFVADVVELAQQS